MRKLFFVVTILLGVMIVVMMMNKPEPKAHYDAMMELAQSIIDQELTSDNIKKKVAQAGAEKLAEWGIKGVDAETLEQLGTDVDLTEASELGKDVAMNTAGFYLQSHMTVNDYYIVTVGMLNYKGTSLPVTIGVMGKVYVLIDKEQVKHLLS